jgi:predicted alpha/beta-fold hydrolase
LTSFDPLFRQGDLATIAANFWPRNLDESRFPATPEYHQTEPDVRVLALRHDPAGPPRGELVILHGLEGSHNSGYMKSMAQAALLAGLRVHRLNMRTCGGTEGLAPTLYHAGLTSDLRAILTQFHAAGLGPLFLAGYSLGGNVVLKLAGELGPAAPALGLTAVISISTPLDLMACCLRMQEPRNFLYSSKFIDRLKARYRRRAAEFPDIFPLDGLDSVKSVLEFDDKFTSKAFGFGNAANYYATQSAQRFLPAITIPGLLIHAADDPLIPRRVYEDANPAANSALQLLMPPHGGHVGFLARRGPRFWAEHTAIDWLSRNFL